VTFSYNLVPDSTMDNARIAVDQSDTDCHKFKQISWNKSSWSAWLNAKVRTILNTMPLCSLSKRRNFDEKRNHEHYKITALSSKVQ